MVGTNITKLLDTYINALHILHNYGVLDGYGHLSVRNPNNPPNFFMMRQLAPALISGPDDIGEYRVSDAEPVHPGTPGAPVERYIHSELLKRYPDVNVVLHGHPSELISYSISEVPLKAVTHLSGFLGMLPRCQRLLWTGSKKTQTAAGEEVPVFDITEYYNSSNTQDFLVRDQRLGAALADVFGSSSSGRVAQDCSDNRHDGDEQGRQASEPQDNDCDGGDGSGGNHEGHNLSPPYPPHNVVLMKSHGFTAVATDIKIATFEGIYAVSNARVLTGALKIQHAYSGQALQAQSSGGITYLDARQIRESWATEINIVDKPWALWVKEVKLNPLYVNKLDEGN